MLVLSRLSQDDPWLRTEVLRPAAPSHACRATAGLGASRATNKTTTRGLGGRLGPSSLSLVLPAVPDSVELTAPKGAGVHCGRQGCGAREGQRRSQK